jgi:hypothetical protein
MQMKTFDLPVIYFEYFIRSLSFYEHRPMIFDFFTTHSHDVQYQANKNKKRDISLKILQIITVDVSTNVINTKALVL